jgi:site-specific DNA recombinase
MVEFLSEIPFGIHRSVRRCGWIALFGLARSASRRLSEFSQRHVSGVAEGSGRSFGFQLEARLSSPVFSRPGRGAVHLFAGFAYCECGTKMYVWSNSPKYICQACRNKIPIDDLEEVFRAQLHGFLISPEEIVAHTEAASEAVREKLALVAAATAELRKIEAEAEKVYRMYIDDLISKDDFARQHKPLSARRVQLEDELPRLEAEVDVLRIGIHSREAALSDARDLATRWGSLPFQERRLIVETITDRVVVGKGEVEISLLYAPVRNDAGRATHSQGFSAATSWKRAG